MYFSACPRSASLPKLKYSGREEASSAYLLIVGECPHERHAGDRKVSGPVDVRVSQDRHLSTVALAEAPVVDGDHHARALRQDVLRVVDGVGLPLESDGDVGVGPALSAADIQRAGGAASQQGC